MRGLSLRTKVFFLFAATALLIVVPALLLIARAVERGVYERARDELNGAGVSLGTSWEREGSLLATRAEALALNEQVRARWAAGDNRRLQRALTEVLKKDEAIVIDSTGKSMFGPRLDARAIASAVEVGTIVALTDDGKPPLRFSLEPVWADTLRLGQIGVGQRLSAKSIKADLGRNTEVVLMVGDSLAGSTL